MKNQRLPRLAAGAGEDVHDPWDKNSASRARSASRRAATSGGCASDECRAEPERGERRGVAPCCGRDDAMGDALEPYLLVQLVRAQELARNPVRLPGDIGQTRLSLSIPRVVSVSGLPSALDWQQRGPDRSRRAPRTD